MRYLPSCLLLQALSPICRLGFVSTEGAQGCPFPLTPPQVSDGQHELIITQQLWDRCQALRASRRIVPKPGQKAARIHLLQSLAVCAHCGRRLRVQTPKNYPTYYREDSHLRGYYDCPYSGQSIHADRLDEQVAVLIQLLKFTPTWKEDVRKHLHDEQDRSDPETERKEIRSMLRLMRNNYGWGLYEGEEYLYWQKVNSLKEKLDLLTRLPESAIERAALTLLNLHDSQEWATREERKMLVRTMIQEVGCYVGTKRIMWVKVNPEDYEILFRLMDRLHPDAGRRYWIREQGAEGNIVDIGEEMRQTVMEVKIAFPVSHNTLTIAEEYAQ